ncbi:MAG TPA: GTPase HflX [Kiritimatiellia bacterium]|nr:GTPase HflX [Kiritimatiellia bacterium]
MTVTYSTSDTSIETVLLVGTFGDREEEVEARNSLDELCALCETAGAEVADRMLCRVVKAHPGTLIGTGKAEEIAERVKAGRISTVVFDDELSPAQGRNLEKVIQTKVVDRTQVILDIFAQHARTREGQMQIELAQMEYLLPRLRRMWTHLERQRGGIGMHGPGEKQLEMDRRRILETMSRYKSRLALVSARRHEQRRGRRRHGWALVSLVGYTNAGKSTLINALTEAGVLAYDKLFATLDPTTRQMKLPNHQQVLLTDTVGFIRKLPHHLVDSFRATLEEVVEADLLVHVIDGSHPQVHQQVDAVEQVLKELGAENKPVLAVLNKMDLEAAREQAHHLRFRFPDAVAISAATGEGLEELRNGLADALRKRHVRVGMKVPPGEGKTLAALKASATIFQLEYDDEGAAVIDAAIPVRMIGMCRPYVTEGLAEDAWEEEMEENDGHV